MGPKRATRKAKATDVVATVATIKSTKDSSSSGRGRTTKKGKRARGTKDSNLDNDKNPDTSPYFNAPESKLSRSFYEQDTVSLAKAMLGKVLCRRLPDTGQIVKGTIVETEAYPGTGDAASRSYKGVPTPSSKPMFMDPGTAYVYLTYGMYHCFNVSANDLGGACLFRGLELLEDYEICHLQRRPKKKKTAESEPEAEDKKHKRLKQHELANGPSKLCLAFNITKDSCNTIDMSTSDDLWLEVSSEEKYNQRQFEVGVSRRVGIDNTPPEARNKLYRFFIQDNAAVSKAKFAPDKGAKTKTSTRKRKLE